MNKAVSIVIAPWALLAAAFSCSTAEDVKEDIRDEADELVELSFDIALTKTSLQGGSVTWEVSDKVSVWDGLLNRRFEVSGAGATTTIRGKARVASSYSLLYPYDPSADFDGQGVSTLLPESQHPEKDGFDGSANLICAVSASGGSVQMKNACALLRFTLGREDIASVSISSACGTGITGRIRIDGLGGASPTISGADNDKVTAAPADGGSFTPGTYNLCIAPCTLAHGIKVRLVRSDGRVYVKALSAPFRAERGKVTNITAALDDADGLTEETASSADFSVTSPHPRLFAGQTAWREYVQAVMSQKSRVLYLMHNEVMATAVRCVNRDEKMDNTLDASGTRMLDMARDAFGRIFMCAYAYRFTGEKRFLDRAEDLLNQICDFPDWNKQNHYLDTSTLTHAASVGYDWLYDDLSSETKSKLEQKVFEYSLDGCLTDASSYINPASGWNTTITSGMILGGIAFYDVNPTLCKTLISTAVPSNKEGLVRLLGTDGSDPMGTMYWRNFVQMEMLSVSALRETYSTDFGTSDYIGYLNTPTWYIHLIGSTGRTFRFGDNNSSTDTVPAMFFFAALNSNPSLPYFELKLAEEGQVITGGVRVDGGTAVNMRTYPLALLWVSKYSPAEYRLPDENVHAATDGRQSVVTARTGWETNDHYLAMKGGQANLNHSHMDAGSFCYEAYGIRWADDPLQDSYADLEKAIAELHCGDLWDRTDGSARFQAFRINCRQHNTICVNDTDHLVAGNAAFTQVFREEGSIGSTLDMTAPLSGQVAEARRTALIREKSYLSVTDYIKALDSKPAAVRWNMHTEAVPTLTDKGILLTSGGQTMLLEAKSSYPVEYKIFTNDPTKADHPAPFSYAEEYRENEHYCGFLVTIPSGKSDEIVVTLKKQ